MVFRDKFGDHGYSYYTILLFTVVVNSSYRIMERSRYSRGERPNISTVGIVVSDWTYYKRVKQSQTALKSITFMTWDFGGQEEYYATHQCFLSRRSLYLVVWNVTHGMKGAQEIKPWLLNIQVCNGQNRVSLSLFPPVHTSP